MALRDCISVALYFVVVFPLIGRYGINAIGIGSLVSSGALGIFFLPVTIRRYRMTTNSPAPEVTTRIYVVSVEEVRRRFVAQSLAEHSFVHWLLVVGECSDVVEHVSPDS
jgi:hypothetical protein